MELFLDLLISSRVEGRWVIPFVPFFLASSFMPDSAFIQKCVRNMRHQPSVSQTVFSEKYQLELCTRLIHCTTPVCETKGQGEIIFEIGETILQIDEISAGMGEISADMEEINAELGEILSEMGEISDVMCEINADMGEINAELGEIFV